MTVLVPYSRVLSKQLPIRSGLLTRLISTNSNLRVAPCQHDGKPSESTHTTSSSVTAVLRSRRTYATAAPGRPKAHTGRATASKRTTTTKKATGPPKKLPGTKKAASKKRVVTKKTAKKAKAKPKPKPRKVKKAPSASAIKAKAAAARKDTRAVALLNQAPKQEPEVAFLVLSTRRSRAAAKGTPVTSTVKESAAAYKNLSPDEREALNHEANQNKEKNATAYKKWVQSYTPLQIKQANLARAQLLREAKAKKQKSLAPYRAIKDDRQPKLPASPWALFVADRTQTGDYKGMTPKESFQLMSREYKGLSAGEKKPYEDRSASEKNRYAAEFRTVFGVAPGTRIAAIAS
ncbi:uncharacterized protein AB675_5322 [Cyphellophora attinorum]|uniref:HMG box domain-containing protein n=1 Tax=Cyphellophora attinorum TaxID=1664694 RepID=A0A0N1HC58_9EURO|nr:uncharacterized protein AB675_5322 [Phialophora attinorum]KPI41810.1 hypothetical protein AB675_5322 [Phialophora attinorum]